MGVAAEIPPHATRRERSRPNSGERTMWRFHRDRPDDPQTRERETERLARDEYERPLYGAPPQHHGSPPQQNRGTNYSGAQWTYSPPPRARFRGDPRGAWPEGSQPLQDPQLDRDRAGGPAR